MILVCRDAACRVCQMTFFSSRLYLFLVEIIFMIQAFSVMVIFGINTSN